MALETGGGRVEALYYELGMRTEGMEAGRARAAAVFKDLEVLAAKSGKSIDEVTQAVNRSGAGTGGLRSAAAAVSDVGEKAGHATMSLHGFLRPLESLATESLSANAQVGNLASKLATFGLGTGLTLGILAGVAIIGKAWDIISEGARKAKKQVDDLILSLEKARESRVAGTVGGAQATVLIAQQREAEAQETLSRLQNQQVSPTDLIGQVEHSLRLVKAKNDLKDATENTIEAEAQLGDIQQSNAEKEANRLGRLLSSHKATNAEIQRAADLTQKYQAAFAATTGTDERSEQERARLLGLIEALTAADQKAQDSAKTLAERQSEVRAAFAQAIAGQTPGKADDFSNQVDKLVDAAQKAHLGSLEIQRMVAELQTAHAAALAAEGQSLATEMRAELAKAAGLQASQLADSLTAFDEKVRDAIIRGVPVDFPLVAQLRAAKEEAIGLAKAADDLGAHLVEIDHNTSQGFGFIQAMRTLNDDLDRANADFDTAKSRGDVGAMASAQQRINAILTAQKKLQDDIAAIIAKQNSETDSLISKLSGGVAAIADVGFGLASAFAGANSEITKMLGGISQAAHGIDSLMTAANTKGANGTAPGLGGLLSSASGLLQAAPAIGQIIGGAIGLASSLFGKSPEEIARLNALKENNDRLRELSSKVGDLARINTTGTDLARFTALLSDPRFAAVRGEPGSDLQNRDIGAILDAFDITSAELKAFAQQFGIAVGTGAGGKITIDDINKLREAIKNSELNQFADDFTGQMQRLDAEVRIFSLTKPIQQFEEFRKVIASIGHGGAGALGDLLKGIDLTTAAGIEAARKQVQDLFNQFSSLSGDSLAAFLGGLSPEDFVNAIERLTDLINAQASNGGVAGTGGFNVDRTITEVTGNRLEALLTTSTIFEQQIAANTGLIAQLLGGTVPVISPPPALGGGATGAGGPTVSIGGITVNVGGVTDPMVAQGIGTTVGGAIVDEISATLGKRVRVAGLQRGKV
jgi:hypothetical protein